MIKDAPAKIILINAGSEFLGLLFFIYALNAAMYIYNVYMKWRQLHRKHGYGNSYYGYLVAFWCTFQSIGHINFSAEEKDRNN